MSADERLRAQAFNHCRFQVEKATSGQPFTLEGNATLTLADLLALMENEAFIEALYGMFGHVGEGQLPLSQWLERLEVNLKWVKAFFLQRKPFFKTFSNMV